MTTENTGLTIRFEQTGQVIHQNGPIGIREWMIDSDYRVSTDEFSFTLYSEQGIDPTELLLQPVELQINGASQVLGRIEVTEIGDDGTSVRCSGRDYISEMVECNIDPVQKVSGNSTLGAALLELMRPVGIETVTDFEKVSLLQVRSGLKSNQTRKPSASSQQKRTQNVEGSAARAFSGLDSANSKKKPPPPQKQRVNPISQNVQEFKPKPGEGIYEFCNRLVARFGCTIQPSIARSDVLIDAPDYGAEPLFQLVRTKDATVSAANNIIRGAARRDYSRFPTYSVFTGTAAQSGKRGTGTNFQFSTLDFAKALGLDELARVMTRATQPGRVGADVDSLQQSDVLYRLMYHRDEDSKTREQLELAARRAWADRLRDTLTYSCTVKGSVDPISGGVWSVGAMASVSDAIANVHESLWVAKRTLRYSPGEGAVTDMELIRPGTWAINEEL